MTKTVKKPLILKSAREIVNKSEYENEFTSCFSKDVKVFRINSKRIIKGTMARVDRKQVIQKTSSLVNINNSNNNDLIEMFAGRKDSYFMSEKFLNNSATAQTLDSSSDELISKKCLNNKSKELKSFEYSIFENDIVAMETPHQGFTSLPSNFNDFTLE